MNRNASPGILVDTSVWVEFFNRPDRPEAAAVRQLLARDRVWLAGVVIAEIFHGVRGAAERDLLTTTFSALPFVTADRADWMAAGWTLHDLRSRGITVPVTDAILACLCLRHGLQMFTLDTHFDHFPDLARYRAS